MPLLDLAPAAQREALSASGQRLAPSIAPDFLEAVEANWNSVRASQSEMFEMALRRDIVDDLLDEYHAATGETLENPMFGVFDVPALPFGLGGTHENAWDRVRDRYDQWAEREGRTPFPTDMQLDAQVLARRQEMFGGAQQTLAAGRGRTGGALFWGGLVGGTAGAVVSDPLIGASMGFGATWATGLLRTALIESGIGAASEFAVLLMNMDRIRQVDPNFSFADMLRQSAAVGGGAAVFASGLKLGVRAVAGVWNTVRGNRSWPDPVRDAGNVVEGEAILTPNAPTAEENIVQRAAAEQAAMDLAFERPVTVPGEAEALANARTQRVFDADGGEVTVRYEVVESADLIASHLPDFRVNPDYPAALQPRDRSRAGSQTQVQAMAGDLNPELLGVSVRADSGAPIAGRDNIIDSGNGRFLAVREAYRQNGEGARSYRAFLEREGFDLSGFNEPVLIARRVSSLEDGARVRFATAANRSQTLRMGATETAQADARLIDEDLLGRLRSGDPTAAANRDFVRGFAEELPQGERGEMFDADGALSLSGARRIQAALLARAYGEPTLLNRILEDTDSNIKTIAGAMTDTAGRWAQMRDAAAHGAIPRGMDITRDLLDAVRTVTAARDAGVKVRQLADQAEMFGGPSEISKLLLRAMFRNDDLTQQAGRNAIGDMLASYAEEAQKNLAGARLFGEELRADEVLESALGRLDRELPGLAAVVRERTTAEQVAKAAEDPVTEDATVRAAEELTLGDQPQTIRVAREDADGNVTFTDEPLDKLLDEADVEIAAAREIEACASGTAAEGDV